MYRIEVLEVTEKVTPLVSLKSYKIVPPMPFTAKWMCIGIDPGTVNLGVAALYREDFATIIQAKTERKDDAVERILNFPIILSTCLSWYAPPLTTVIEGASFGDTYRQVELAEIRAASVFWSNKRQALTKIIPPKTIRKEVFGNGSLKADDVWTGLPRDALAALSCAYYAMGLNDLPREK